MSLSLPLPHLMLAQGHIISVSAVGAIAAVVSVYVPRKHSVPCGHTAHVKFLCFSSKIKHFVLFP